MSVKENPDRKKKKWKTCFFPGRTPQGFSFSAFFRSFIYDYFRVFSSFTFPGCFYFSPFSVAFIFHPTRVFSHFIFLRCCIFNLFREFFCCCTASTTDWRKFFYSQAFFTLHSFPTFRTTICFYHDFPRSLQFFLQGCRASQWGSKRRPGPSVCLNHIVFRKRY